jgi:predicted porin
MKAFAATFTTIALAAASLSAQAQSSVQLTGTVDSYVGSMKMAGQERVASVGSGGLTTSWWGVKGVEDLGGGLKADFNITGFFRADTGTPGRFDADPFFSRDANVGLAGSFGRVSLGRGLAPNFLPTVLTNPFGDSFTVSPLVLHANMTTAAWGADSLTTASNTGWSNQILYSTPSFGGLKANVHYQFGEQTSSGNKGKKNVGLNLMYSAAR